MTRKLRRSRNYEIVLEIKEDNFIRPPRDAQRHWLLNKAMAEFAADIEAIDEQASQFVSGATADVKFEDRTNTHLSDDDIMEDWQIPLDACNGRRSHP